MSVEDDVSNTMLIMNSYFSHCGGIENDDIESAVQQLLNENEVDYRGMLMSYYAMACNMLEIQKTFRPDMTLDDFFRMVNETSF
jgi:hypothetical protein